MKRILLVTAMLMAVSVIVIERSAAGFWDMPTAKDEEALKRLVNDWKDAAVHGDLAKFDRFAADNFSGSAADVPFKKRMLMDAFRSGQAKVGDWTMDEVRVRTRGNEAMVTGRSTLSNATYKGRDFSGNYEWVDQFVKEKDGSWRAVSSHAKLIKK